MAQQTRYWPLHEDTNPYQPEVTRLSANFMSMHVPLVLGDSLVPYAQRHDQFLDNVRGQQIQEILRLICDVGHSVAVYSPLSRKGIRRIRAAETVISNSAGQVLGYVVHVFYMLFGSEAEDSDIKENAKNRGQRIRDRKGQRDPAYYLEDLWRPKLTVGLCVNPCVLIHLISFVERAISTFWEETIRTTKTAKIWVSAYRQKLPLHRPHWWRESQEFPYLRFIQSRRWWWWRSFCYRVYQPCPSFAHLHNWSCNGRLPYFPTRSQISGLLRMESKQIPISGYIFCDNANLISCAV